MDANVKSVLARLAKVKQRLMVMEVVRLLFATTSSKTKTLPTRPQAGGSGGHSWRCACESLGRLLG